MRTLFIATVFLLVTACVQDEGAIDSSAVSGSGSTTGSTSGGSSGSTDDPLYEFQWHLNNTGQDVGEDSDYPLATYFDINADGNEDPGEEIDIDIDAAEAHDAGWTGAGVRVVVSDSGTDYTHPDLSANQLAGEHRNYSFVDPARWDVDAEAYPSGNEGHGTAVAGIISAEGWNGVGVRGVAPDAQYSAFKFLLSSSASDHDASLLAKELHQLDGDFDIFNFSYGYSGCFFQGNEFYDSIDGNATGTDEVYNDTILAAVEAGAVTPKPRTGVGAVYVQSAGNSYVEESTAGDCYGNTNSHGSLATRHKVVVGAISGDGNVSSYSSPGASIWVAGIGGEGQRGQEYVPAIYTTDIGDCSSGFSFRNFIFKFSNPFNYAYDRTNNPLCEYTNIMNGTSSAAPMVSGVVALMLEVNPALTWRDVKYILAITANQVDYFPSSVAWVAENNLSHPNGNDYSPWVYDEKWIFNGTTYTNGAGYPFSNWYGFGLVNAFDALSMAATHTNLPAEVSASETSATLNTIIPNTFVYSSGLNSTITDTLTEATNITIESIRVRIRTNHTRPGDLGISLTGPNGTHKSHLLLVDSNIQNEYGETEYTLVTNAFFEESSAGAWTIEIFDGNSVTDGVTTGSGDLVSWDISFYGR